MPKRDGTGPQGRGSKTGRGLGRCSQDNPTSTPPEQGGNGSGRGFGQGSGQGRGQGAGRGRGKGRGRP